MRIEGVLILQSREAIEDDDVDRALRIKVVLELGSIEANQPQLDRMGRFARRLLLDWIRNQGQVEIVPDTEISSRVWKIQEVLLFQLRDEVASSTDKIEYEFGEGDPDAVRSRKLLAEFDSWEKEQIR